MTKLKWGRSFNNWSPSDKQAPLDAVPTAGTGEIVCRESNWIVDDEAARVLARKDGEKVINPKRKIDPDAITRLRSRLKPR